MEDNDKNIYKNTFKAYWMCAQILINQIDLL